MKKFNLILSILLCSIILFAEAQINSFQVIGRKPENYKPKKFEKKRSDVIIEEVSPLDWAYGCSATAAAMIAGYYDRKQFKATYKNSNNEFPVSTAGNPIWETSQHFDCPLSATKYGVDGRTTAGHVNNFYVAINNRHDDPDSSAAPGSYEDCTGDYMGTSQDHWNNSDGGTTFFYNPSGAKTTDYSYSESNPDSTRKRDGIHGLKLFFESRGYEVTTNYNQYIIEKGLSSGFSFDDYKAEIDAGRPVLIHVDGHTMTGVGYNHDVVSEQEIILFDTWGFTHQRMDWNGEYPYGATYLQHYGVSAFNLHQIPTFSETESTNGILSHRANFSYEIEQAGDSVINSQGYYYSTSANSEETGTQVLSGNGTGELTATLTNLDPNTTYYVRSFAQNSGGTSYGNEISFTTEAEVQENTETVTIPEGDITNPIEITDTVIELTFENVSGTSSDDLTVDEVIETPQNPGNAFDSKTNKADFSIVITQNNNFTFDSSRLRFNVDDLLALDNNFFNKSDFSDLPNDAVTQLEMWKRSEYQLNDFVSQGFLKYHDNDGTNGNTDDYLYLDVDSFSEFSFTNNNSETLPVQLSTFTASLDSENTIIEWRTESEVDSYGYNIFKSSENLFTNSEKLNSTIIPAENSLVGATYSYTDYNFQNSTYYWLEAIDLDSSSEVYGPIFVTDAINYLEFSDIEISTLPDVQIALNWKTSYENPNVKYYDIFRSENSFSNATKINENKIFTTGFETGDYYNFINEVIPGNNYNYWLVANSWDEILSISYFGEINYPEVDFSTTTSQKNKNNVDILINSLYEYDLDNLDIFVNFSSNDFSESVRAYNIEPKNMFNNKYKINIELPYEAKDLYYWIEFSGESSYRKNGHLSLVNRTSNISKLFPNPYSLNSSRISRIMIQYNIYETAKTKLTIYNLKGQKIKILLNEVSQPGNHEISWNCRDNNNEEVSSGIYFVKMKHKNHETVKKLTLIK